MAYVLATDKSTAPSFQSICRVGGRAGWLNNNRMWRLRGLFDRILGGVGSALREILWSCLSAFLGIAAVALCHFNLLSGTDQLMVIGSFGASAVLLMRHPRARWPCLETCSADT